MSDPIWLIIHLVLLGIAVLFGGLVIAYLSSDSSGWQSFPLPKIFWLSSVVSLGISYSLQQVCRMFQKERAQKMIRFLMSATLLAIVFMYCQYSGWHLLQDSGITMTNTPSASYLYVITGLHALHVVVGIGLLFVALYRAYRSSANPALFLVYNSDPIQERRLGLLRNYWYTIDFLWLFLFLAFLFRHA